MVSVLEIFLHFFASCLAQTLSFFWKNFWTSEDVVVNHYDKFLQRFLELQTVSEILKIYVVRCFKLFPEISSCNFFPFHMQVFTETFISCCAKSKSVILKACYKTILFGLHNLDLKNNTRYFCLKMKLGERWLTFSVFFYIYS